MSQKNIRKALVESDTLVMNKISAEMIALMITPASRSVWTGTRPSDTTTRYMVMIVAPAPRNANRWRAEKPANAQPIPICRARTAPRAAPLDTPRMYGSARGLRSRAWSATPTAAKLAPTRKANNTLGNRTSSTITLRLTPETPVRVSSPPLSRIRATSPNGIRSDPNWRQATPPISAIATSNAITRLQRLTVSTGSERAPVWMSVWDGVVIELLRLRSQGTDLDGGS